MYGNLLVTNYCLVEIVDYKYVYVLLPFFLYASFFSTIAIYIRNSFLLASCRSPSLLLIKRFGVDGGGTRLRQNKYCLSKFAIRLSFFFLYVSRLPAVSVPTT
jgi:hypothetical protein